MKFKYETEEEIDEDDFLFKMFLNEIRENLINKLYFNNVKTEDFNFVTEKLNEYIFQKSELTKSFICNADLSDLKNKINELVNEREKIKGERFEKSKSEMTHLYYRKKESNYDSDYYTVNKPDEKGYRLINPINENQFKELANQFKIEAFDKFFDNLEDFLKELETNIGEKNE